MRRYVLAFLACIIFAATAAYATTANGVAPPTASSIVKVLHGGGHGSGVHIGNGYIITAAHVIESASTVKLKLSTGKEISGEVLWSNKGYDIALVRTDAALQASKLSCRAPKVGETIVAAGNPTILEFVASYGKVAGNKREFGPWKSIVVTDITTVPGMSGGPVFDDDGNVVGIAVGVLTLPAGFSISLTGFGTMVPGSTVCELLGRGVA